MSKEKKVVIDIRMFCLENRIKIKDVCEQLSSSSPSLSHWRNEAPESLKMLYRISLFTKIDVFEFLKDYDNPTNVLAFVRDFMTTYGAKFEDIIYEI